MSALADFTTSLPRFYRDTAVDQLLILAWYAEAHQGRAHFDGAALRQSFKEVGVDPPDMSVYLPRLAKKKPPQLIREKDGYRLSGAVRRSMDKRFGSEVTTVAVTKALSELPNKLPNIAERDFLKEALNCYRAQAYRATIVMTWNLTYDHLIHWIMADSDRVDALNVGISSRYQKKNLSIRSIEDFEELKESEFIEAARTGKIFDKNTAQILREKLNRRNMAAHPSRISISQHQADDMITDLVSNVLLKAL